MKARCYCMSTTNFQYYGAMGITVCEEWRNNRLEFIDWALGSGYTHGLQLDRINVRGGYSPSNCRWVSRNIQNRNTRKIRINNKSGYRGG